MYPIQQSSSLATLFFPIITGHLHISSTGLTVFLHSSPIASSFACLLSCTLEYCLTVHWLKFPRFPTADPAWEKKCCLIFYTWPYTSGLYTLFTKDTSTYVYSLINSLFSSVGGSFQIGQTRKMRSLDLNGRFTTDFPIDRKYFGQLAIIVYILFYRVFLVGRWCAHQYRIITCTAFWHANFTFSKKKMFFKNMKFRQELWLG